jgi:hypothetical protein
MLTFLFWNIRRNNVAENIARLVERHSVDMVILAESEERFVSSIKSHLPGFDDSLDIDCPRIQIYTRFPREQIRHVHAADRFRVVALQLADDRELLIMGCHFISLVYGAPQTDLNDEAKDHAETLRNIEAERGHRNTLVVGDLNLDPFAEGVAFARGFHGVMSKTLANQDSRTVYGRERPFFYNPMWSRYGDGTPGPPGSYFYRPSGRLAGYFWHYFDQVLVRPALLDDWQDDALSLPTSDGMVNFLKGDGTPNGGEFSDHLPLIFSLNVRLDDE